MVTRHAIIVHGWEASSKNHWIPWLSNELTAAGINVHALDMPDTMHPRQEAWVSHLAAHVTDPANTILIGHSMGGMTVLRLLERWAGAPFANAVIVAAPIRHLGRDELADFFTLPVNFSVVRGNVDTATVIHGDDDPIVPVAHGHETATALNCEITIIPNGHHLGTAANITSLPPVLHAALA